jgi:site-specific recombinase XerD
LTLLEQEEFIQAIGCCKRTRDRALATLLLNTGIRISECQGLNVGDLLFTAGKPFLKVRSGKARSYREVALNKLTLSALQEWLYERHTQFANSKEDALFLSNRGTRLSLDSIDHAVRKLAQRANLHRVSNHTLRHTCLTNLIHKGTDIAVVARVGGHKKLETTMRYRFSRR